MDLGRPQGGIASMSTALTLSTCLRGKLNTVAGRIRRLRLLRGASLLLLTVLVTAAAAFLADGLLYLPAAVRTGLLAGWAGLGALVALFGVLLPVCRSLNPTALAAIIEEKYPELGERLTSSVELADTSDIYH